MAVSLKLGLKQNQKLALTQSLRQSIEMLQLSTIELSELVAKELQENPILEEESVSLLPTPVTDEDDFSLRVDRQLSGDEPLSDKIEDRRPDYEEYGDTGYSGDAEYDERKRSYLENAVADEVTLKDHLLEQARMTAKDDDELEILEAVITTIDENGFLSMNPEDLAAACGTGVERIMKSIAAVSVMDPVGCGVPGIRESLMVQARHFYPEDAILRSILGEHFKEFENLDYEKIAKSLGLQKSDIVQRSALVHNLNPFPGRQFSPKKVKYIIPDIEVKYVDGEIVILMNDDWVPRVRINSYYINLLRKKSIEKNIRDYIQDKVQSARYLIRNISGRRDTILKVVRAIMERQTEFLQKGPGHLKPLTNTDVARELGLHESTVSRVSSNKFVQTGWGVFELKYFFVSKLKSKNEEDQSSDRVMKLIRVIITGENPVNPYSDEDIMGMLRKENINIARRTIAKYRGILNIPPSNKRKKLNMIKS